MFCLGKDVMIKDRLENFAFAKCQILAYWLGLRSVE